MADDLKWAQPTQDDGIGDVSGSAEPKNQTVFSYLSSL